MKRLAASMIAIAALAGSVALAQPAHPPAPGRVVSQPHSSANIAAGLAEDTVEVKVNYSGARIVLFADSAAADQPDTGFAIALIGPSRPATVTHNTPAGAQHFRFVSAPSVFAIGAEPQVAAATSTDVMIESGLNAAASAMPTPEHLSDPDLQAWRDAYVKLMIDRKLYSFDDTAIQKLDGGLRRARMNLPPNAPPGVYQVRAVVFRNGQKIGESVQNLNVVRGGADATLFDLSRNHGLIYGVLAVLVGTLVGGIAAWIGRR